MTQIATVERVLSPGRVEIVVARQSACAHDCGKCAGCGGTPAPVRARASDPIGTGPGEKVVVESRTRDLLGIAALVYLLPMAGLLMGYLIAAAAGTPTAVQYGAAVLGAAVGIVPAFRAERRIRARGGPSFTVVRRF